LDYNAAIASVTLTANTIMIVSSLRSLYAESAAGRVLLSSYRFVYVTAQRLLGQATG
jgi:hypothetical protein